MYGQCNVGAWRDITEIAAYQGLSVGVRKDGTVVTCGDDGDIRDIVSKWNGIEHVYTGLMKHHLVGLKYDGTVVATSRDYGEVSEWRDVIDIACDYDIIAGLRGNGTVSFAGDLPSEYKRKGKSNVRAVNVKSGIVTTILSDGKTIVDHVYTGEETETTELDIQFVMGRNGVFHVIYVLTDGSVFVAPLKETPAPLDQTDGWLMLASLDSPTAPPAQQNETRTAEELPKPTKQPAPPPELTPTPSSAGEQNREEARAESIMDEMFIYDSLRDAYISETPTEDPHKDDYIAACVFADYDCPEMCTLRRYRDQCLATSWYGRLTVKAYRFMSPLLVKCLGKATGINRFLADKLTAKVKHLNESGVSNDDYEDKNLI